jgi:hypothetical protein
MKKLLLFLAFAASAFAQSAAFYTYNVQVSPTDLACPYVGIGTPGAPTGAACATTTLDGAVALANYLFHNSQSQTTLTGNCAANATACTFANVAGVVVGNGICFSAPCTLTASATGGPPPTAFSLSSGEIALVTGISGNTLTLKRSSIGTAAAATSGQGVTILIAGSYSIQSLNLNATATAPIIQNAANGAYTVTTQATVIAAAQASINGAH